jgi:hypothetical protein
MHSINSDPSASLSSCDDHFVGPSRSADQMADAVIEEATAIGIDLQKVLDWVNA